MDKITSALIGKEKCLFDYLLGNQNNNLGSNFINNILSEFDGDNSEFNIKIISLPHVYHNGNEVAGKTSYSSSNPFEISIEINTSIALARPSLGVIRTILHELIHADMMRKIHTSNPNQADTDFYNTYNYFKDNLFQATAQHETMALLYVDNLKNALKDYHRLILVQDYNYLTNNGANPLPDDFYEAMAWRGLAAQNVQAYIDLSQTRKDELDAALSLYYFTTTSNCP